jgi:hypothetical protein
LSRPGLIVGSNRCGKPAGRKVERFRSQLAIPDGVGTNIGKAELFRK